METKFNSQICTTREQSERLLALGLKKETADMGWMPLRVISPEEERVEYIEFCGLREENIPAWSLHRLIEMIRLSVVYIHTSGSFVILDYEAFCESKNIYDNIVDCIEWLIKEGYFNKEYLV